MQSVSSTESGWSLNKVIKIDEAQIQTHLDQMKLHRAAARVHEGVSETLSYYLFPPQHRRQIRTNNLLGRIRREIRRRSCVLGCFRCATEGVKAVSN